ncbi:hypothetical protein RchiOBHm_Chr2g0130491 [Rosa chinensis]|uniref:Uncharacterized protein n=1 Tax=Rosa chinensis TaxID=74649 RepID=A0A2P6RUT8_ROSCH|nr:hypothetical protein RchiOBHm_Chr2g0130491 [Rosa chinensis]
MKIKDTKNPKDLAEHIRTTLCHHFCRPNIIVLGQTFTLTNMGMDKGIIFNFEPSTNLQVQNHTSTFSQEFSFQFFFSFAAFLSFFLFFFFFKAKFFLFFFFFFLDFPHPTLVFHRHPYILCHALLSP